MPLFTITGLTKQYTSRKVLDIPSLRIEKGRIYALLGPNGAGKTTLLNILGFLDRPSSGEINYQSETVTFSSSELKRLRREIVLIDQHPILFTTSVYKNIDFGLKIRGIPKSDRKKRVDTVLDMVGMKGFINSRAYKLSGGETRRVAIARALALKPKVLLCDEPTSNVDAENQAAIINILKRINDRNGISIIFTSHDPQHVASLAHTTMNLNHGRLTDNPVENIFTAVLSRDKEGRARCTIQDRISFSLPTPFTGKKTILIDPEKIYFTNPGQAAEEENCFRGRVKQVSEDRDRVRMIIDMGVWITLLLSKARYKEHTPLVGEAVGICIPPEAIKFV